MMKICVLPGDGIGKEIVPEAVRVLKALDIKAEFEEADVGGVAYRSAGHPLPEATLKLAKESDAILFGAIGDFSLDTLPRELRPEQAILGLRRELNLFANFRPAIVYPELVHASSMKPEFISGLDMLIVRELTGDIYFGQPRAIHTLPNGEREGYDTMRYKESEIRRVAHVAFQAAQKRSKRLCSVDKANVLETMQLWREVVTEIGKEYPDVALEHMYVDNATSI
jgi:3-isopropylmalate dehydrogenase